MGVIKLMQIAGVLHAVKDMTDAQLAELLHDNADALATTLAQRPALRVELETILREAHTRAHFDS